MHLFLTIKARVLYHDAIEAVDEKLQRRIALKCGKIGFRKRLPPEVRNATAISHPNVCKTLEIHTATLAQGEIDFLTSFS